MTRLLAASILLLALAGEAVAQSAPFVYPRTVGTSSSQVLAANPARKRVTFVNPNATSKIAVCPVTSRVDGSAVTCTVGGPGSITLIPYDRITIDAPVVAGGSGAVPSAWNAISDTGSSSLTVIEFE